MFVIQHTLIMYTIINVNTHNYYFTLLLLSASNMRLFVPLHIVSAHIYRKLAVFTLTYINHRAHSVTSTLHTLSLHYYHHTLLYVTYIYIVEFYCEHKFNQD